LRLATVKVLVFDDPTIMLRLLGAAVRLSPRNENFTETLCVRPPSPAMTVTV